jgi:hypothetical protein
MRTLLMSLVAGALVLGAASAQAGPVTRSEANVPFAFVVNGQEMPAGTYTVQQDSENSSALLIRGEKASAFIVTAPVNSNAARPDAALVFSKDGDRYRLIEVWDGNADGHAVLR